MLGIGNAALDIVNEVADYPREDEEVRALAQHRRIGGNVANSLMLLRQLGHTCKWCGTIGDDAQGDWVLAGLRERGIDIGAVVRHPGSATPTSHVTLSRASGSRTIVHFRDLPEMRAADFARLPLRDCDWVHFEGRNPAQTALMLRDCAARCPGLPVSLEVEKRRPGIEPLLNGPRVLIFSRAYALACGFREPKAFLAAQRARTSAELLLLPWGGRGAFGQARDGALCFAPAHSPDAVRDTLGAGDVFNAAVIDGMLAGLDLPGLLAKANALAGHKCGRPGLDDVVDTARGRGLL